MDVRKARVLSAVIDDYIQSAEPVGSQTLAKRYGFGLSSATLRNELADLEELGYLDKPHTSAGRVPSDKGYRYYVDRLLVRRILQPGDLRQIRETYRARFREVEWFLHQTAKLVSAATQYPTLVMAPPMTQVRLQRLSFVPLANDTAIVVIETDAGLIESRVISIPDGLEPMQLARIAEELSQELYGAPLSEVAGTRIRQLERRLGRHAEFLEELLTFMQSGDNEDEQVTVQGALKLLNYPEFQNPDRVRAIWDRLAQDTIVNRLLTESGNSGDGVSVQIGTELPVADLSDLSVVSVNYHVAGKVVGRVAVVGPRRMDYGRVMAVLEQVAEELTHALNWL